MARDTSLIHRPRRRDGELFAHRQRVTYKRIPLVSIPQADEGSPWLPEDASATEWLGLFYSESKIGRD